MQIVSILKRTIYNKEMSGIAQSALPFATHVLDDNVKAVGLSTISRSLEVGGLFGFPVILWMLAFYHEGMQRASMLIPCMVVIAQVFGWRFPMLLYGSIRRPVFFEDFAHHKRGRKNYLTTVHLTWIVLIVLMYLYVFNVFETSQQTWIERGSTLLMYALAFDRIQSAIAVAVAYFFIAKHKIAPFTTSVHIHARNLHPKLQRSHSEIFCDKYVGAEKMVGASKDREGFRHGLDRHGIRTFEDRPMQIDYTGEENEGIYTEKHDADSCEKKYDEGAGTMESKIVAKKFVPEDVRVYVAPVTKTTMTTDEYEISSTPHERRLPDVVDADLFGMLDREV